MWLGYDHPVTKQPTGLFSQRPTGFRRDRRLLWGSVREARRTEVQQKALPEKAFDDALQIAVAAVHGMNYLLTWNCRHIDNAQTKPLIRYLF